MGSGLRLLFPFWGFLYAAVVVLGRAPPSPHLVRRQTTRTGAGIPIDPALLQPPSRDPWYAPPPEWEGTTPGTVLKVRPSAYPYIPIVNASDTFQVLFRSSDTHGNASWSVSTVFIPWSHVNNCHPDTPDGCAHGIVSLLYPYDSSCVDASPGYLLQWGESYGEMVDLLRRGWFVAITDYEGPHASYGDGPQAAYATLDAARAVLEVAPTFGLREDRARLAIWGYSGGAHAAHFAAELHDTYAPDLPIAGFAIGGAATNTTTTDRLMNKKDTAGLVIQNIVGLTSQQPEERRWVVDHMKTDGPYNATGFFAARNLTGLGALLHYAFHDIEQYFVGGARDLWGPELSGLFDRQGALGHHGVPRAAPAFVYKVVQDEMGPIAETDALVRDLCRRGANILYHRNSLGTHNVELFMGRPRALQFLETVLDGANHTRTATNYSMVPPPPGSCTTVNVTVDLDLWNITAPDGLPIGNRG